jgi:hypothetical protein
LEPASRSTPAQAGSIWLRPNGMRISCRPLKPALHKSTLPLFGQAERGSGTGLRPALACRLHLRVRLLTGASAHLA